MSKNDVVVQAIEIMKQSQFKLTAIKVELEAQLGRRSRRNDGCGDCNEGRVECGSCEGYWEEEGCDECDGDGNFACEECENEGRVENPAYSHSEMLSATADSPYEIPEFISCTACGGVGTCVCDECEGSGVYRHECEECGDGTVECDNCDGSDDDGEPQRWGDELYCHEWLMERLSHLGLATQDSDDTRSLAHDSYSETDWIPVAPLVFAEFYRDGSVDSEFTFTLSMEDPKSVLLLPKFIEVFNEFAALAGTRFDTHGAGMHMALLNDPECAYPTGNTRNGDIGRLENFARSMGLLLPALYFLGSSNEQSRGLDYRRPEIGRDTHRAAVDFRGGALEFRVFNTCYANPEAILDNVVVMKNCIRYWSSTYRRTGLSKITPQGCPFGVEGGDSLSRFYITSEHIALLNNGLRLLKPSYYTIREIKNQRKFNMTQAHVKNRLKRARLEAEIEYKEYEDRFGWSIDIRRSQTRAQLIDRHINSIPPRLRMEQSREVVMAQIELDVEREVTTFASTKESLERYIERKVADLTRSGVGSYNLRPE